MKMTRKLLPLSLYDGPGMESWLESRANEGLFPVKLGYFQAVFSPIGVPGTRFRLVVKAGKEEEMPPQERELFEEAGWRYISSVSSVYYLFCATDPNAAEIYSDRESRGISLEPIRKRIISCRRRRWAGYAILAALLVWAMFFYSSEYDTQPDRAARLPLQLLILFRPNALLLAACMIGIWVQSVQDSRLLHRTYQALIQGLAPPSYKGNRKAILCQKGVFLVLLALMVASSAAQVWSQWARFPLEDVPGRYVSLQSLEQQTVLPWEELADQPSLDGKEENYAQLDFSLLAPGWYTVTQKGYSPQSGSQPNYFSPDPENGEARYAPSLDATYFDLLMPALARPVAQAQMDLYRLVNLRWTYEESAWPGLDFVIHATEPGGVWQMLAIGKGSRVAVFRYAGQEDLKARLPLLSQTL